MYQLNKQVIFATLLAVLTTPLLGMDRNAPSPIKRNQVIGTTYCCCCTAMALTCGLTLLTLPTPEQPHLVAQPTGTHPVPPSGITMSDASALSYKASDGRRLKIPAGSKMNIRGNAKIKIGKKKTA